MFHFDVLVIAIERNRDLILSQYHSFLNGYEIIDIKQLPSCKSEWLFSDMPSNRRELKCYFYDFPNVGDSINNFLMDKLFNIRIIDTLYTDADITGIGSILDDVLDSWEKNKDIDARHIKNTPLFIWGSGFMYYHNKPEKFIRNIQLGAVRGNISLQIINDLRGNNDECVLADPGLLISKFINSNKKLHSVGIIPHHYEVDDEIWKNILKNNKGTFVIDVRRNPLNVLYEIASCETIISTSLHGLIFADSLNIPNLWCHYSDKTLCGRLKFDDYYSSYNIHKEPFQVNNDTIIDQRSIVKNYDISHDLVVEKQEQLIETFDNYYSSAVEM